MMVPTNWPPNFQAAPRTQVTSPRKLRRRFLAALRQPRRRFHHFPVHKKRRVLKRSD